MDITDREVKMLTLGDGESPFEDWYRGIKDGLTRTRIRARLARLELGNFGDYKPFAGGVMELRLDFGPGYRVYVAQSGSVVVVLLGGGDKSTKTFRPHKGCGRSTNMTLKDFNETFADELCDPEFAASYLQYALEDGGMETFLVALRNVAKAQGGMTELAQAAALGRESLYKTLSEQGNPEFRTLQAVLGALGLRFSITRAETVAATVGA